MQPHERESLPEIVQVPVLLSSGAEQVPVETLAAHTRVYVDAHGVTRFAPFDLAELHAPGANLPTCTLFDSRPPGAVQTWHNALVPMLVITLRGRMEVEIEGGETCEFGPGDVRLAEDTTGRGHQTRVLGDEPWQFAVLMLEPPPTPAP